MQNQRDDGKKNSQGRKEQLDSNLLFEKQKPVMLHTLHTIFRDLLHAYAHITLL